ncbi:MAG TPA: hypothetical protein VIH59_20475 [Candidatus Tectomicrobia bacterium]
MDLRGSHAEEEFRQKSHDFLKAELPQGWNDALVLDKESNEDIALTHSFTHKVGVKGWQRIGPRNTVACVCPDKRGDEAWI